MIMYLLLSDTTVKVTIRGCMREIRTKPVPVRACCPQAGACRHGCPQALSARKRLGSGARRQWCPQALVPAGSAARRQWCPQAVVPVGSVILVPAGTGARGLCNFGARRHGCPQVIVRRRVGLQTVIS